MENLGMSFGNQRRSGSEVSAGGTGREPNPHAIGQEEKSSARMVVDAEEAFHAGEQDERYRQGDKITDGSSAHYLARRAGRPGVW